VYTTISSDSSNIQVLKVRKGDLTLPTVKINKANNPDTRLFLTCSACLSVAMRDKPTTIPKLGNKTWATFTKVLGKKRANTAYGNPTTHPR
jgi:hypothetical protein